jgi:hypothetical protein
VLPQGLSIGVIYRPPGASPGLIYRSPTASPGASLDLIYRPPTASPGAFYRLLGANSQQLPGDSKSPGLVEHYNLEPLRDRSPMSISG